MERMKSKVPFLMALSAGAILTVGSFIMSPTVTLGRQTDTHGFAVSSAVHAAQDAGTPVNEAATEAAHDRSTLPEGAQNAPGQQDDADVEAEDSDTQEGNGKGKSDAAPGQNKGKGKP